MFSGTIFNFVIKKVSPITTYTVTLHGKQSTTTSPMLDLYWSINNATPPFSNSFTISTSGTDLAPFTVNPNDIIYLYVDNGQDLYPAYATTLSTSAYVQSGGSNTIKNLTITANRNIYLWANIAIPS